MTMADPTIEVLGIYRLEVTDNIFQAQLPMYGDEDECRDHFSSVALIEVIVRDVDERFDLIHFTQPGPPHAPGQCAYDEALLSLDGLNVIARDCLCMENRGPGPLRFAFYLHYYDATAPLPWTYGFAKSPPVEPMPERLRTLVPYRPCD